MANQAKLYTQINQGQLENGEALLKYAAAKPCETVLDIGCGTGELTFKLAEQVTESGKVIAIDPDKERLAIAKQTQPKNINNIIWVNDYFTEKTIKPEPTFDLAFSNYVFHWFAEKESEVKLLADCLKPGGRFAIQLVYDIPQSLHLVREFVGKPIDFPTDLREQWLSYFDNVKLKYEIKNDATPYYHPDIDDLLKWYEATTHGVISRADLSPSQLDTLKKKYPGELYLDHPTLRLVGYKP